MKRIGIDLGGTKTEGVLLDKYNNEISRLRVETQQSKGYKHVLNVISDLIKNLEPSQDEYTIGIGTPGFCDRDGFIRNSGLQCINNRTLINDLEKMTGHKISTDNDANCFALAEALLGAGRDSGVVFGIILGTGCGGGLIINGKVRHGIQNIAGEIGHTVLHPGGIPCFCGKNGCAERYVSGTGVEERHHDKTGTHLSFKEIMNLYYKGDVVATETIMKFFDDFGIMVANLVNILDPDCVVLGGGVSNFEDLYTLGAESALKYIFKDEPVLNLVKNKHGDSAGVLGAALL